MNDQQLVDPEAAARLQEIAAEFKNWKDPRSSRLRRRRAARALIENVEWMLDSGEAPLPAAERLGYRPKSLARRLARVGRDDLARPFWKAGQS